ncbi:MAG: hypothetical protein E7Z80_06800 [Methanobrevibacter thaueri]|nr:hypothetical protein [Methanobrevibacter thaueri]
MKLDKISIKNYRQYRDVEIKFDTDLSKNFTIIKGNNGTGKTTLLNAFTWCLYGKEIHSYGQKAGMLLCNNKSVTLAEPNENIPVSVTINFLDDKGRPYIFERSLDFYKTDEGILRQRSKKTTFKVTKPHGNDFTVKYDDEYTIKRFIPKKIQEYFFFDGARLGEYFQTTSNQNIKGAVFDISQLNIVDSLKTNLGKVVDNYITKQRKLTPKVGNAQDKINKLEKDIEDYKSQIKQLNSEIKESEDEIDTIDKQLLELNEVGVTKAVEDEKRLVAKLTELDEKLNGKTVKSGLLYKRNKLIIQYYPLLSLYPQFFNFLELGEDSRKKGFIPPKYKKSFLKDLLDDGKCICGADLNEDIEHREAIIKLLNETNPITDASERITSILTTVRETILKTKIKSFKDEIIKVNKKIMDTEDEIEKNKEELRNVRVITENNSIDEIRKLSQIKKDLRTVITNNSKKIGSLESQIKFAEKELRTAEQDLKEQQKNESESLELSKKIEFAKKAKEDANTLYETLSIEMKDQIQSLTKDKFTKIQWKENEFVDIDLTEDYDISIINKIGNIEKPGDLSDGEKLSLGLCFMSALHKISGFDLPIIMDTPLGNLDVDIRQNIAKFLPEFVESKQIVLLVTGTEYTDDFRDILYDHIGNEYVINWDNSDEGKESKVVLNG